MIAALGVLVQLVLLVVVLVVFVAVPLVAWDITVGPSAQLAREHDRQCAGREVHGR